jgi:hypothetical protein
MLCESMEMLARLLRQHVRPYRRLIAVITALQLISGLASLYLPTLNATIIDDGVAKGDTSTIVHLGAVMLAVSGLAVLCSVGGGLFRVAHRDRLRPRPTVSNLSPCDRPLDAGCRPVRRAVVVDPHHQ